jgi:hypothetical protein
MPRRRSSRSRRRALRRWGQALYVLGALLMLAAIAVVIRPPWAGSPTRRAAIARPTLTTAAPAPVPLITSPTSAADATDDVPQAGNTPPSISAPGTVNIAPSGASAVPGLSLTDAEAREGDIFGVLVSSREGRISLGTTQGLRLVGQNGTRWIPFEGRIAAVNAALATLRYTPTTASGTQTLVIVATDNGHRHRYTALAERRVVYLRVTA